MVHSNKLHIIAFNVPYPADYGGVIDVFYKLKQLHRLGIQIYLHCFTYGRKEQEELKKYCKKVYYYSRKSGVKYLFKKLPYIVATRNSPELLQNLLKINAPILFEGLHSCYFINHPKLKGYKKIVRAHNIEHNYYEELANVESSFTKKEHFKREAKKLALFERNIQFAGCVLSISPSDQQYFEKKYANSHLIPGFHKFEAITSTQGKGKYILFHGNLGVAENQKAVSFILDDVQIQKHFELIIAGKNPTSGLIKHIQKFSKVTLVANPGEGKMNDLIKHAHICFIPTFQATGLKLKLLGSLFAGRFCVTNSTMVKNTGLEGLCYIKDSVEDIKNCIFELFSKPFTETQIRERKNLLESEFSNILNAQRLFNVLKNLDN